MLWKRFTLRDTGRLVYYTSHSFKIIFEKHSKHFQHLYFNGEFEQDLFLGVRKLYLTQTLGNCSNLVILDLTSNFHIEDISFAVNLLYLKELHIEHCVNIDDEIATRVLSSVNILQALETLNLRMCVQFDSEQLISIGLSHPSLRLYRIDGCDHLEVLSAVTILNCSRSLVEFFMTPDLDLHTIQEWNYLESMFGELRLC